MLDASTDQDRLRGGRSPWHSSPLRPVRQVLRESRRCEVLVVGAGITGSLMAEILISSGHEVCVIDREIPGRGSTTASTAMLQWEIDKSLSDLTDIYGFERGAFIYRQSLSAVSGLIGLVSSLRLPCQMHPRQSLYLAAGEVGASQLIKEHELRKRAQLPGEFLDHRTLLGEFGIHREAAILSPGSADADPLLLSEGLLASAVQKGATLFGAEAKTYDNAGKAVAVEIDSGHVIEAQHVVLATGYVMPDFIQSDLHKIASSWAIATQPIAPDELWRDGDLIWEASEKYNYARTTADHRIIIGGEDDDQIVEPEQRDALIPEKSEILLRKLEVLWPRAEARPEFEWAGAFSTTGDGLPLIGRVPGHPRLFAAYGYGGNGITFSFLASQIIARMIAGDNKAWFDDFALDRDAPTA